jgi:hypothetical protein
MVGYVVNNPLMRQEIERLQSGRDSSAMDIGKRIDEALPVALAYVQEVIGGIKIDPLTGEETLDPNTGKPLIHSDELRYKAAKDLLGMGGHGPVQRVRATVSHGIFTPEDIERFKQRAREVGIIRNSLPENVVSLPHAITDIADVVVHDAPLKVKTEIPLSQQNEELVS